MKRAYAFMALGLVSLGALAFDFTLPLRLPGKQDYAEAAAHLRGHYAAGDAVQIWPPWLEEARLAIDVAPVLAEEDLQTADYPGAQKLWLLELPPAPFAGTSQAEAALRSRGATLLGEPAKFGPLALTAWDLHAPPFGVDLVFGGEPREWHEVQYVSRACRMLPIGSQGQPTRAALPGAVGSTLHLRAGVIGEHAYSHDFLEPIHVEAWAGEQRLADLSLGRTHDPAPAWLAANVPFAGSPELQLELRAWTAGGSATALRRRLDDAMSEIVATPTVGTPTIPAARGLSDAAVARLLGLATFLVLFATQGPLGFTRDESFYFSAATSYEEWIRLFLSSPVTAADASATERFFRNNWEHPGFAKMCFATSHLILTRWTSVLSDTAAWRLPAWVFAGVLTASLARFGFTRSRAAGFLAPLLFWCAERTFITAISPASTSRSARSPARWASPGPRRSA